MKITMGSDHAGYNYKEKIKRFLTDKGHEVVDFGTNSTDPVDYPLFIRPVAEAVARGEFERGIILGGSGNGEAMVANRIRGIRCALCWDMESARLSRQHNDANMLSLGERLLSYETAQDIVTIWMDTPFEGGRHKKRIAEIDDVRLGDRDSRTQAGATAPHDTTQGRARAGAGGKPRKEWDLLLSFRSLKYMEGDKFLEFNVDPGLKSPTVIRVPSPERWEKELPEWARGRRDEILGRIKPECGHIKPEWREY